MLRRLTYVARLVFIARTLQKHDALFPLERLDAPPFVLRLARLFAGRSRRNRDRRPGERLAAALEDLGPSFIKLGQALSVRSDLLGEGIADDLGRLRDRLPAFGYEAARQTIEKELEQPLEQIFLEFQREPVAAASIAQVHFATVATPDGPAEVAVKVLRPGIEDELQRDMDLFFWLARIAERADPKLKRLRPVDIVRTLQQSVALELDLRLEAAAADEMGEVFSQDPDFRTPLIDWERTAGRVMTMERIVAVPIGDNAALDAAGIDRPALAERVIRIFLRQSLAHGFFHADMHQGNLFVDPDGTVVAVDYGIMGRLDHRTRLFMAEMLGAFIAGDYRRAAEVHIAAGYVPPETSVDLFAQACRSIGAPIRGKPVSEISIGRLMAQLFRVTETFAMETRTELLLLQKTMVTVEGVSRGIDPDINFWSASQPVIEGWARDNLGPEARIAGFITDTLDIVETVPRLLARAEQAFDRLEQIKGEAVGEAVSGNVRWAALAGVAGVVAGLLVALALGEAIW